MDARDAAQAAARREGLSLGEWLTRRILKRYSELSLQEREDEFNKLGHRITEVSDRLGHVEGSFRSEPLREAVKKLHQGLGRLSTDLVQTTGESTIRISALSRELENVLGKIAEIGETVSQADSGFKQRIEAVQQRLDAAAQKSEHKYDALAQRVDRQGQTFDDALVGISRSSGALQSEVVRVAQGLEVLDSRLDEANHLVEESDRKGHEQASRIADTIENFGTRLDRVCAATAESASALHSRVRDFQEKLGRLDVAQNEQSSTVAEGFESLHGKISETATDAAGMCSALDHRLLLVQQNLQALDQRHAETAHALAKGRGWVAEQISEGRSESLAACASLDARIAATHQTLHDLDRRHGEATQALDEVRRNQEGAASAVQVLGGSVTTLRAQVAEIQVAARASDHNKRLLDLAGRADATEAALSVQRDKLGQVDQILDKLDKLDVHHGEAMVETHRGQEAAASAAHALQGGIVALESRLSAMETDPRTANLEQRLQEFVARAQETHEILETRSEKIAAVDDISARLENLAMRQDETMRELAETQRSHEPTASALQSLESRVEGLRAEFAGIAADSHVSGLASRFDDLCGRTQALETGLELVQEHTKVVGNLLSGLDARVAGEAQKQQDGLADLKSELLDEISRSLLAQVDAEARKQEQAIEELHANFAANTLKVLEEKIEADARTQRAAMTEPAASFVLASSHGSFPVSESEAPVVADSPASEPHQPARDTILELDTPAPDISEPEPVNDTAEDLRVPPPPFAEPALAPAAAMGAFGSAASEPLDPAMVFANEPASATLASPASFLSAARQSLQEAAQKHETESRPKSLFGFPFFRQFGHPNKGKNDTTSYALLAGVALVAIVAIAVTTGELVKRSQPVHVVRPTSATLAIARHSVRRPAASAVRTAAKMPAVTKTTAAPRLEELANAGDPQAQLLLGLQEIGTNTSDAAKWLGAAAQQGMPVAQYRIATLYAQGRGVPTDAAKAFYWYGAAAKGGNRKAMSNLAVDFAQGSGTTKNPQEAARWFSKAAELGLVDAQFDLAVLYERGLGVPQSLIDAYRWYLVAAKAGDRESKDRVDALASQLSPQDRAAAETAAAQFKPGPMNVSANDPQ
ncbi:MAG: hypothetical protein ACREHF_08595 [Rhizomicrobium sp.]